MRHQETVSAPGKAHGADHAIRVSLRRVSVEAPSHGLIKQKVVSYPARPADIKPVPAVVERISMPARTHKEDRLPSAIQNLAQHSGADSVLFETRQKASSPAGGGNHVEKTYFSRIRRLLEAAKQYPEPARRAGVEGRVGISFYINRYGYIIRNIEVFHSSGSPILDRASIACVNHVDKFPPFPAILKEDFLKIRVYLVFELGEES